MLRRDQRYGFNPLVSERVKLKKNNNEICTTIDLQLILLKLAERLVHWLMPMNVIGANTHRTSND